MQMGDGLLSFMRRDLYNYSLIPAYAFYYTRSNKSTNRTLIEIELRKSYTNKSINPLANTYTYKEIYEQITEQIDTQKIELYKHIKT